MNNQNPIKYISGKIFGRLSVIDSIYLKGRWHSNCICICGNKKTIANVSLKHGKTKSCGCIHKETSSENGKNNKTHGLSNGINKRLYDVHRQMMLRCYSINSEDYSRYGMRGILVCKEWHNVKNFFKWAILSGYRDNLTIERKNVNAGYNPDNCCWIENKFQAHNTRRLRKLTFKNETLHCSEWARKLNLSSKTIIQRLNRGWDVEKTLTTRTHNESKTISN